MKTIRSRLEPLRFRSSRSGVTIAEVLFAMGIALTGLVGIAAMIPLAGRQADYSYALTRATSIAEGNLSGIVATEAYRRENFIRYESLTGTWTPVPANNQLPPPAAPVLPIEWYSYCVDPIYWGSQPTTAPNLAPAGAYQREFFPHYAQNYNPLSSPFAPSDPWTAQPRMFRVTYPGPGAGVNARMPKVLARQLFAASDDIAFSMNEEDESIRAFRSYYLDNTNGVPLKSTSHNEFEYLMTCSVVPALPSDEVPPAYNVALVVFANRNLDLNENPVDVSALPEGERVTWATPPEYDPNNTAASAIANAENPVSGNVGFELNIYADFNVDDSVRENDWVLLSRRYDFDENRRASVFAWAKVTSVSETERTTNNVTDPYRQAVSNVWRRRIRVTGADWIFQDTRHPSVVRTPGPGQIATSPTTVTLFDNIVTVHQRAVEID